MQAPVPRLPCPAPPPPCTFCPQGGSRARSLYATPPSPHPPAPGVLRDSGVGAMAPTAPNFFCACFPFIKPSMF